MDVFFNELSVRPAATDAEACQWLETLAELGKTLKDCVESLSDNAFTFRRSEEFGQLPITTTQTLLEFLQAQYEYGSAIFNFLLGVFDSPYITENDPQRTEFEYTSLTFAGKDYNVTGLAAAHLKNSLAVSFDSDLVWDTCYFAAQINRLDANASEISGSETIAHASQKQHLIDCHLAILAGVFDWDSYHPKPTTKGLLPLIAIYSLHVSSWEAFYHNLSQIATGERVHEIILMSERIANVQRWAPAIGRLKSLNNQRTIYTIRKSPLIVSVDTQHGEFEVFDQGGSNHLGSISFDGKRIKGPDPQRYLRA